MDKKNKIGTIYKIGAFLAFVLLGYLGIRSYKLSVEKLKINGCIDEIAAIYMTTQEVFKNQHNYKGLDYKAAVSFGIIPKKMFRQGPKGDAINSYDGGVDIYHSSMLELDDDKAFAVAFQGLSSYGCQELLRSVFANNEDLIAVGGYATATASNALEEVFSNSKPESIKRKNIFLGNDARFANMDRIEGACMCGRQNTCTVVWKFK